MNADSDRRIPSLHYSITPPVMLVLLPCQPPEQKPTENNEKNIRKPDQQFRVGIRISTERIADDNKQKIGRGDDQTHCEPD